MTSIAAFVKQRRKEAHITQEQLAEKSGVALTVIRKIEQGKTNLTITSVNLILQMFGHELAPINSKDIMK
jgi:y4mF family transcriptional regulator